ncbi:MAG: phenylalanine--tRNA ligase subunit alpha [Methanocalculaceae archaeon]|jgi:phenylalanyl-tRNA synthetase alpha chain|nr:phenylalanine--tRNA ligase subunit alpha [Methanocalculaceae archaeon]
MDLTINEKRVLAILTELRSADAATLSTRLDASVDTVVQWAHLCADRGLVTLERCVIETAVLTDEGKRYAAFGLPERQVFASIHGPTPMDELTKHPLSKIAIGWLRKKKWITIDKGVVTVSVNVLEGEDELALKNPVAGTVGCQELVKRGLAKITETVSWIVSVTPAGVEIAAADLDLREEIGIISREQILSGEWKNLPLRRYNVDTLPKRIYGGRLHPNQQILDEIRALLFEMGFTEFYGSIVQNAFWNFDSLYQPQDHPAREMQDTFHLSEEIDLPDGWEKICDVHITGGNTGSTGWGGEWSPEIARKCVLRTHSTSLSIQYLAKNPIPPLKAFSISRVYRRETIDPTHLPEFEQLEGIVMDEGLTFGHLLGFFKEFFGRIGFESIRFRPGYFPYTEPSVEPEVWVDGLGWVELGGAGVFRKEVTAPWGIDCSVLAWGLGVSRVSMLRMGLKDLRQLYRSDIEWIRSSPVRRV